MYTSRPACLPVPTTQTMPRPRLHQLPPLGDKICPEIGDKNLAAKAMGEGRFGDLVLHFGAFRTPHLEARTEAMRRRVNLLVAQDLQERHIRQGRVKIRREHKIAVGIEAARDR